MRGNLEASLISNFAQFFRSNDADDLIKYGFQCGDGWYQLLYDTFEQIAELNEQPYFVQIKEKFGQLRMYASNASGNVQAILLDAERKSGTICDVCGRGGHVRFINDFAVAARCDQHSSDT